MSVQEDMDELDLRIDALDRKLSDRFGRLEPNLEKITAKLQRLTVDRAQHPPAIHWAALEARDPDMALRKRAELQTWICDILVDFPGPRRILAETRNCWRTHPDVDWYLTAAWIAWVGAWENPDAAHTAGAVWLRDFLSALTAQLERSLGPCRDSEIGHVKS